MSNRSAARGTAAASSMRLTLRTSNAVATSSASPSRCFLFCDGSRAARSARTAAATVSTPPIPKAPPNQRRSPPITSTFQAARVSDGCQGEHSDTLMIFLLKARRPQKFKDRVALGGDLEAPPIRSENVSAREILERRLAALAARSGLEAIQSLTEGTGHA